MRSIVADFSVSIKELNEKVEHLSTVTVTAIQQSWEEAKSELKGHTSAELSNVIETLDSRMKNLSKRLLPLELEQRLDLLLREPIAVCLPSR
jgi:uncharacterized protein YoxC